MGCNSVSSPLSKATKVYLTLPSEQSYLSQRSLLSVRLLTTFFIHAHFSLSLRKGGKGGNYQQGRNK